MFTNFIFIGKWVIFKGNLKEKKLFTNSDTNEHKISLHPWPVIKEITKLVNLNN